MKHADFILICNSCLGLDFNVDPKDKIAGKVIYKYIKINKYKYKQFIRCLDCCINFVKLYFI